VGAQISMAEVGHAEQNGYAERMIRTVKEEEVYLSDYRDHADARSQTWSISNPHQGDTALTKNRYFRVQELGSITHCAPSLAR